MKQKQPTTRKIKQSTSTGKKCNNKQTNINYSLKKKVQKHKTKNDNDI